MIIPKKIKVGPHTYKVIFPYKFKERYDRSGQSNHDTLEIFVASHTQNSHPRPRTEIEETVIHEILHAVDSQYNAAKLEEEEVTRLSVGLYQALKDAGMFR